AVHRQEGPAPKWRRRAITVMTLRARLNRLQRRFDYERGGQPALEALVRESATLSRWLVQAGFASPHAALAAGARTPVIFRHVTIEAKAHAVEQARLWRRQRANEFTRHTPTRTPHAVLSRSRSGRLG